jgi:hypothetical protein
MRTAEEILNARIDRETSPIGDYINAMEEYASQYKEELSRLKGVQLVNHVGDGRIIFKGEVYSKIEPSQSGNSESKYLLIAVFADNGEHSHWALIKSATGVKVWSEDPVECKAQGHPVRESGKPHGFCEGEKPCSMDYCDDSWCNERKITLVEPWESVKLTEEKPELDEADVERREKEVVEILDHLELYFSEKDLADVEIDKLVDCFQSYAAKLQQENQRLTDQIMEANAKNCDLRARCIGLQEDIDSLGNQL